MPQSPYTFPPGLPIRSYESPNIQDGFWIERVDLTDTGYVPLRRGTPFSSIVGADKRVLEQFAELYFLRDVREPYSSTHALRYWATDLNAESSYAAEATYLFESVAHPAYARIYTIRREVYEASPTIATGTALTALIAIKVTAGGTGYTKDDVVNIVGTGSGATAKLVVDEDGVITAVVVTVEGTGYTEAPTITVTSTNGAGATLVGVIQPQTAILVAQKKEEFPADSPWGHEFVKVLRIYETLPGPILYGQEYNRRFNIPFPYTKQIIPANTQIGDPNKEITPIDTVKSEMRTVNSDILLLDTYSYTYADTTNLNLPDVLTAVEGMIEKHQGDGGYTETGAATLSGGGSISLSIRGEGQASATIIPEILLTIKQTWAQNVPTMHHVFFLPVPFTNADILIKLSQIAGVTVLAWPKFSPVSHTIVGIGRSLSLRVNVTAQATIIHNDDSGGEIASEGEGFSREVGLTLKTVRIPPTIHGIISLTGILSDEETLVASAAADAGLGASASISLPGEVASSITPTSLAATAGATTIPTSGKRLHRINPGGVELGWSMIDCEVVDFADVPS